MHKAIELMGLATAIAFFSGITALPALCIFRRARRFAGICYIISSFVFGFALWVLSALTVYAAWGAAAVTIGVLVFGIGVVPMTVWILAWDAQWLNLAEIALLGGSLFASRMLGVWLVGKYAVK